MLNRGAAIWPPLLFSAHGDVSMKTSGWNIWAKDQGTGRVRLFTVAVTDEVQALAALQAKHPSVEPISRHVVAADVIAFLGGSDGKIVEWIAADGSFASLRPGGEPLGKPMA